MWRKSSMVAEEAQAHNFLKVGQLSGDLRNLNPNHLARSQNPGAYRDIISHTAGCVAGISYITRGWGCRGVGGESVRNRPHQHVENRGA